MATAKETARHLDLGDRRFRELVEEGTIERRPPGEYDIDHVRVIYIRHLRKAAAGRGVKTDLDLASERAMLTREQTAAAALKNAVARGEYVAIEEVGRQVENEYGLVRQRILAMPGKLADALEGLSREEREAAMTAEVTEALNELHEPARVFGGADGPNGSGAPPAAGAPSTEAGAASQLA